MSLIVVRGFDVTRRVIDDPKILITPYMWIAGFRLYNITNTK